MQLGFWVRTNEKVHDRKSRRSNISDEAIIKQLKLFGPYVRLSVVLTSCLYLSGRMSLLYRDKDYLQIGGVNRYVIKYKTDITPEKKRTSVPSLSDEQVKDCIYFRLKNDEKTSLRAIHLLNGPFILYCHVVPCNYNHKQEFKAEKSEIFFKNEIKPGQTFNVPLKLNQNSLKTSQNDVYEYEWSVDVVSQIVITTYTRIHYDFMIGEDFEEMKKLNHGPALVRAIEGRSSEEGEEEDDAREKRNALGLSVSKYSAEDMWSRPPANPSKPAHLVIVTHGIFSNTYADMLYLKDSLENKQRGGHENIIVRGYLGNAGHTERGIKRLGTAVGEYIIDLIGNIKSKETYSINKISFIGHSLGGTVQLYAIKYILVEKGVNFFSDNRIELDHLICLASPFLGVLNEMSFIISWFLDIGALGKTGRDLTLLKKIPTFKDIKMNKDEKDEQTHHHIHDSYKPLLEMLPNDPLQGILRTFNHLTLYANAVNDGIVPLRTSSLLYLDWDALGEIGGIKEKERKGEDNPEKSLSEGERRPNHISRASSVETVQTTTAGASSIGEVPEDGEPRSEKDQEKSMFMFQQYLDIFSLNRQVKSKRKKLSLRERRFKLLSAKGTDPNMEEGVGSGRSDDTIEGDDDGIKDENDLEENVEDRDGYSINIPPKASAIESALSTILCPVPSATYIIDPNSRHNVIFHDKYYNFKSVPEPKSLNLARTRIGQFLFKHYDSKVNKQVKIARKYHDGLTWRKVLVHLPPDAHNNIIVRRRFSNGYGWGVIDHVVELFQESKPKM